MDEIEITGYEPGVIGRITELQAIYYAKNWGLGLYFEAKAATEMSAFLSRFNPASDGAWIAKVNGDIVGGIFIDGKDAQGEGARLRWFIIDPAYQGRGIGNQLMEEAVSFCKRVGFRRVYLTTFGGLNTARHLYEKYGFQQCGEEDGSHLTGTSSLVEQIFELILADRPNANS